MLSTTYIFACKTGQITSYPHDYAHEIFKYAIDKANNSVQIVLVRKDNLLHYCYVRKIREKQYFGICFRTDHIYNSVADLFRAFDRVYADMVSVGILLQMDSNANVVIGTTQFAKESVEINEQSEHFINSLMLSPRTTQLLPPADFSKSINDCIDLCIEKNQDTEIIDAIKKYSNVYIVKTQAEIARLTAVSNIIKGKNEKIKQLQEAIVQRDATISKLKKEKNKFKWVLILLSIIFIGSLVFFIINNEKNIAINNLQEEKDELNDSLSSTNTKLTNTRNSLISTKQKLSAAENTITNLTDLNQLISDSLQEKKLLISTYPLIIQDILIANTDYNGNIETTYGGKIFSSNSMYFKPRISYIGLCADDIQLDVKWFYPNGTLATCSDCGCISSYSQCDSYTIKSGPNNLEMRGFGGKKRGNWNEGKYSIEIWCKGNKIAERTFIIY